MQTRSTTCLRHLGVWMSGRCVLISVPLDASVQACPPRPSNLQCRVNTLCTLPVNHETGDNAMHRLLVLGSTTPIRRSPQHILAFWTAGYRPERASFLSSHLVARTARMRSGWPVNPPPDVLQYLPSTRQQQCEARAGHCWQYSTPSRPSRYNAMLQASIAPLDSSILISRN